jgi:NADH-quinone oxidoreductase subunit M
VIAIFAGSTIILGAVYMLRMYKNVMQGETNPLTATFKDVTGVEKFTLCLICVLVIALGIYPQPILHISEAAVTKLVNEIGSKFTM